jgi:hypothetical protein
MRKMHLLSLWRRACTHTHTKWLRHAICDWRESNWWAISLDDDRLLFLQNAASLKVKHGPSVALDAHFDRRANCTSAIDRLYEIHLILVQFLKHILVQFHPRSSSSVSLYCEKRFRFCGRPCVGAKSKKLIFACIAPFLSSWWLHDVCEKHLHLHA